MKKRIVSMLLALVLAGSLAACGSGKDGSGGEAKESGQEQSLEENSEEGTGEAEQDTEGQDRADSGADGTEGKFDPLVTVTTVRPFSDATQGYGEGEDLENNAWTRLMEDKYGIDVKYKWVAPTGEEYNSKLNLDISSGELVDFFRVDKKQLSELVEADMIQPLDEVWEKYASERTRNLVEVEGGEKVMEACMYDGKMMAIPFTGNPKESAQLLYIRQDWLDNLNLEAPKTMDDVIAIAEAFASQDPDRNGVDDTYAVVINQRITGTIAPLFYAKGSYPGSLVVGADGKLTTGFVDENTKEVLELLNKWYQAGYIDSEWFTKDSSKAYELLVNGKVGLCFGSFSDPLYPMQPQHDLEPESDWLVMEIPGYDGEPVTNAYTLGISAYYVASREFEHPEAMVMMLNEWVDLFYYNTDDGLQREYINSASGAEVWLNAPIMVYRGFKNVQCGLDITDYYAGNKTLDELTAEERGYVEQIDGYKAGDQSLWAWNKIFGPDGAAAKVQTYIDRDAYIFNEHWGNPTATEVTNGSILSDYQLQNYTSFINGERSFDEWDDFVNEYRGMGYDQILEEYAEQYQLGK